MGTGYTRNDTLNNIADGNIINASDLDGEFDAVESAFNESTGHTHDGTAAEGAPITVLGPVQDFIASATEIKPKTTNTLDIGTVSLQFKDMYLDGTAYLDDIQAVGAVDITGDLDVDNININGNTIISTDTNGDINLSPNGTGTVVINTDLDVDNININGNTISSTDTNGDITLDPNGTGVVALSSADLTFGNNYKAIFGAGSGLQIYHDGADSVITEQGTGSLYIGADSTIALTNAAVTQNKAQFITGGAVNLFHNNALKLATTATGVDVTGTVTTDGLTVDGTSTFSDAVGGIGGTIDTSGDAAGNNKLRINSTRGGSSAGILLRTENSGLKNRMFVDINGDISFYDSTGVTQGLFWDASTQRLGLGTTSPSVPLHVKASSAEFSLQASSSITSGSRASFNVYNSDVSTVGYVRFGAVTDNVGTDIQFANRPAGGSVTERMRIDSSGNLLVGTTNANPAENNVAGIGLLAGNTISVTDDGGAPIQLNRKTSDGSIAIFRKDGTTVGSIGTTANHLTIGNDDVGLRFHSTNNLIYPHNMTTGATPDGTISFGTASSRFKDLYLSGIIQLGDGFNLSWGGSYGSGYPTVYATSGSGGSIAFAPNGNSPAANQVRIVNDGIEFGAASSNLNDYEEGATSGTLLANSGSFTTATYTGRYRKIGSLVNFAFEATITTIGSGVLGFVVPLPFTAAGIFGHSGSGRRMTDNVQFHTVLTDIYYVVGRNTCTGGDLNVNGATYRGSIVYEAV
jgi:hypothetical protein